jgi:hypothetical protein
MKINCPKCKTASGVREILYGMPSEEPDPDVFIVGGCLVERNQPTHRCITCGWERIKNRFVYDEEDFVGITIIKAEDIEGS